MEFVSELSKEEYEEFVSNNKNHHFMQSYDFGEIRKFKHVTPHHVGLKKDGTVVSCGNNNFGQCNVEDWRSWLD